MGKEHDRRLKELSKSIKEAKSQHGESVAKTEFKNIEASEEEIKSARAGSEFLASVLGGGLLGYGVDWLFGTLPWGIILFLIMGFASGVYRANAQMKEENEKNAK